MEIWCFEIEKGLVTSVSNEAGNDLIGLGYLELEARMKEKGFGPLARISANDEPLNGNYLISYAKKGTAQPLFI
jgi:hypothetical protein